MRGKTMTEKKITHTQLVSAARQWALVDCKVVCAEMWMDSGEQPDVIGWTAGSLSIVVECKTSRSDFLADAKKPFRARKLGMGQKRWFFTPKDLITLDELPPKWGLIEYHQSNHSRGYMLRNQVAATRFNDDEVDFLAERRFMVYACHRATEAARLIKPVFSGE